MKITTNILRNVCALFLTVRDQAEAEGYPKVVANAQKQYQMYRELLIQAYEKRPSGVGAGRPSHWKIIVKTSLPRTGGVDNLEQIGTTICESRSS